MDPRAVKAMVRLSRLFSIVRPVDRPCKPSCFLPVVPIKPTPQRLILFQEDKKGDTTAFLNIAVIPTAHSHKVTIRRKSWHSILKHFHACNKFSLPHPTQLPPSVTSVGSTSSSWQRIAETMSAMQPESKFPIDSNRLLMSLS